jgi:hypothetical protein
MNTDTTQITTDEKTLKQTAAANERGPAASWPRRGLPPLSLRVSVLCERGSLLLARAIKDQIAAIEKQIASVAAGQEKRLPFIPSQ